MGNPFDMLGGMGGMGGLGGMFQSFQQNMQRVQEEIKQATFTGDAGNGLVKVVVTGGMVVQSVEIDDSLAEDKDMLEDLVLVATNQALSKAQNYSAQQMQQVTAGLPIPPGMLGF